MCKVQMLRALVKQRLTAAAEEIFGLFERTIAEYEEELSRSKEENERQRKLLDAVFNPQLRLHRADIQQLLMVKEEVPLFRVDHIKEDQEEPQPPHIKEDQEDPEPPHIKEEQEDPEPPHIKEDQEEPQPPHIKEDQEDPEPPHIKEEQEDPEPPHIKEDQEDPEPPHIKEEQEDPEPPHIKEDQEDPEPPHIKEEQEELWSSQEGEQLQGLEEADITKFPFSPVPVKSEDDEEKPQSSQLHQRLTEQMETEADGEDCGGPEPDRDSHPDTHLQTGDSSEVGDDLGEPPSTLNRDTVTVSDESCHAEGKPFSCSECGKRFHSKTNLNIHMRVHTGENPFGCSVCGRRFNQKQNLVRHMTCHTGEKAFSCSLCRKRFKYSGDVRRHMRIHMREKQSASCDSDVTIQGGPNPCDDRTESPLNCQNKKDEAARDVTECERRHKRIHTAEKPFSRSVCGKGFSLWANLMHHMTSRKGETPSTSGDTTAPITHSNIHEQPERHFKRETEDTSAGFSAAETEVSCDDLNQTTEPHSGSKSPKTDVGEYVGGKSYVCAECGKRFGTKTDLKVHLRVHTGEKPFTCSVCRKGFSQKSNLLRHMPCHTGEKPYSCPVCQKRFTFEGYVGTHMKIHKRETLSASTTLRNTQRETESPLTPETKGTTGPSPKKQSSDGKSHICSECGKRFQSDANLKVHMYVHTKEKPFTCSVCGTGFSQKANLMRHMTRHTGEKPHSCSVCKKHFRFRGAVVRHMKLHTRNQPSTSCGSDEKQQEDTETFREEQEERGNSDPDLQLDIDDKTGDSFEQRREDSDDDDCEEPREPGSGLNCLTDDEVLLSEKPRSCSFCGKSFTRSYSLTVHMRLHAGEKPFSCSVCDKRFVQRYHYLEHTRCHTGENTFDCSVCGVRS